MNIVVLIAFVLVNILLTVSFYIKYSLTSSLAERLAKEKEALTKQYWEQVGNSDLIYREDKIVELESLKNELLKIENLDDETRTSVHKNSIVEIIDNRVGKIKNKMGKM
jgi:biopolymer transport protein ExbD